MRAADLTSQIPNTGSPAVRCSAVFGYPNFLVRVYELRVDRLAQGTEASLKSSWYLLGPAFVAAIAYVDPGNVAANVSAGSQYGYLLLWVIVTANVAAGLVQYLSAKLGLVTGRSLPSAIGKQMSRPVRLTFWVQAEIVAMATDVAEVMGGAIAMGMLFGLPLRSRRVCGQFLRRDPTARRRDRGVGAAIPGNRKFVAGRRHTGSHRDAARGVS